MMQVHRGLLALFAALLTAAAVGVPAATASSAVGRPYAVPAAGTFYPIAVHRLLGGGAGLGGPTSGSVVPSGASAWPTSGYAVPSGGVVTVPVAGREGLPVSGISAVLVNVTATAGGADVALTAAASGRSRPETVLLSAPASGTRSSLMTVPLSPGGAFDLYATGGAATVVADVVGFYAADDTVVAGSGVSGGYQPVAPARLYDSRPDAGGSVAVRVGGPGPVAAGDRVQLGVDLGERVNRHVTALVLRVSALGASGPGTLTVSAAGVTTDLASVSFGAGAPATNLTVVPAELDSDSRLDVAIMNRSGVPADVVVDLLGFYDDGLLGPNLRFRTLEPTRVVGAAPGRQPAQLPAGTDVTVDPPRKVAGDNTFGLVGVLTVRAPAGNTDLVVGPGEVSASGTSAPGTSASGTSAPGASASGTSAPGTSAPGASGSPGPGAIPAGARAMSSSPVQPQLGTSGALQLRSTTTAEVTLDVVGSFEAYPPVADPSARAWVPPLAAWEVSAVAR